ncbi:BQ5605_C009g05465 [Microbotryum silenes-dioicae]|uniref:BQ5605_C009g05465 protein n=1 Tax=Microbotryum silenes-dioicae TaxID=796604 RepID=A0A2X0P8J7_9BASI|nr:BQ5605_C009g05465 [Microbotryum silenes-dioicae]
MVGTFEGSLLLVFNETTSRIQYSILAGSACFQSRLSSPVSSLQSQRFVLVLGFVSRFGPLSLPCLSAVPVGLSSLASLVFILGSIVFPCHSISSLIDRFAIP